MKIFFGNSNYGIIVRVFANGPRDLGSIPDQVIPKTQKMVLYATLLNTQHYKVRIKSKVEQGKDDVVAIEKGAFGPPSTSFTILYNYNDEQSLYFA